MSKMKVSVRIPKDLVRKANTAAKVIDKSRGEVVTEALREHLADLEEEDTLKEDVFDQYLDGQISLETLDQFLDRDNTESDRVSKTLLDQGQESGDGSPTEE